MSQVSKFRIVTYNVHKCVGVDRRLDPARIVSVLKEINADIVALQEVLAFTGATVKTIRLISLRADWGSTIAWGITAN